MFFFTIGIKNISTQSSANATESGQINLLIFDNVASSRAFISRTQFVEAWNAALPYLPKPDNVTHFDVGQYPHFMNSAVTIGNINNATQLAMYFAHILYATNGLSVNQVMPCTKFGSRVACKEYININVDNTGAFNDTMTGKLADYRGRGFLFLENVKSYKDASKYLYGNDILYKYPHLVSQNPSISWATSAWTWNTRVSSLVGSTDAFGLTTKFLRPGDCSSTKLSDNAKLAFDIYQQVLSVFDPDQIANAAGCVPI